LRVEGRGRPAVVLLSGGLDSAVCLCVARDAGFVPWTLSFDYGQRHRRELEAAGAVAAAAGVPAERRQVVPLAGLFSGSALTGEADVPLDRGPAEMAAGIPPTYVPARNLVFLALAAAIAEPRGARDLFIGVNALDYSGYPDCRPEFIAAFEAAARLGMRDGVTVHAPLQHLDKAGIVRLGLHHGAPLHLTLSCYLGTVPACGRCDACRLRRKGFAGAGVPDPIPYAAP
jgi:7-cyano-7-deazaguanine synthase